MQGRRAALLLLAASVCAAESLSFRSWTARARRLEREKDLTGAESSWSNALSAWKESDGQPGRARAFCARAALRERGGEDAGALSDYAECIRLDAKNAKALHRRGALRLKAGKRSEAIADFYKAVALDIRFGAAYRDRARAYEESGETAFAREDYKRACELGVKDACPKAKPLKAAKAPPRKETRAPPLEPAAPAAGEPPGSRLPHAPRFADCRAALERCLEEGGAFGACVAARPRCEDKPVKGCCPGPCLKAFSKAASLASEAAAYRRHFSPDAACAAPPPADPGD